MEEATLAIENAYPCNTEILSNWRVLITLGLVIFEGILYFFLIKRLISNTKSKQEEPIYNKLYDHLKIDREDGTERNSTAVLNNSNR